MALVLINSQPLDEDARVSIHDRGFRHGDGLFETIPVYSGVPYQFEWHMDRLRRGLGAIRLSFDCSVVEQDCRRLIHANNMTGGFLRIQVTRGAGGHGYLPITDTPPTYIVESSERKIETPASVTLWLSEWRRPSPDMLPTRYKTCQGMNSTLARMEAADRGCFDALLLNGNGNLCETSSANLFWLKENTLFTPSLECGALEGSARAAILRLSPYKIQEMHAPLDALKTAEAVCISNSALKIAPVSGLDPAGLRWESAALAQTLLTPLLADIQAYVERHRNHWRDRG